MTTPEEAALEVESLRHELGEARRANEDLKDELRRLRLAFGWTDDLIAQAQQTYEEPDPVRAIERAMREVESDAQRLADIEEQDAEEMAEMYAGLVPLGEAAMTYYAARVDPERTEESGRLAARMLTAAYEYASGLPTVHPRGARAMADAEHLADILNMREERA